MDSTLPSPLPNRSISEGSATPIPKREPSCDAGAEDWLAKVEGLRKRTGKPRIIIGVLGSTGAGKSSLINALLDEERLVPTSSMRACTSVITEISYNHDDDYHYKAEVEFLSKDEWENEFRLLYDDTVDEESLSNEDEHGTTPDPIAFAKIEAVYDIT
ncbi:hypothetical protein VTO42DRAFT_23 [Malbranchea cinnamomea]